MLKRHPLSALFAQYDLKGEELSNLAESIRDHGQQSPITLHDGMVLDGWNRHEACRLVGVEPITIDLAPGQDPWEFVKGANMLRRHMSPAERVAVMLLKQRMEDAGISKQSNSQVFKIEHPPTPSVRDIQKDLEVSVGTAQKAQAIAKAQDPELVNALAEKRVSLDGAAKLAKLPEPERRAALQAPPAPKARPLEPNFGAHRIAELEAALAERDAKIRELEATNAAMLEQLEAAQADLEAAQRILDVPEDERGGQTFKELQRANALNVALQTRNNGLMGNNAGLAKDMKRLNAKCERLQKSLDGFREPEAEPPAENPYFDPEAGPDPLIDGLGA